MNKSNKNKIYNAIMVIAIMFIVVAGVMVVGNLRGWFVDNNTYAIHGENVICIEKEGTVNLERSGVSYELNENDVLRDGDIVETKHGGAAVIKHNDSTISLNDNTKISLMTKKDNFAIKINRGEIFTNTSKKTVVLIGEKEIEINGISNISVPIGTINILVLKGNAEYEEKIVKSGQLITILEKEILTSDAQLESLNEFALAKISSLNDDNTLCFNKDDIEKLKSNREEESENAKKALLAAQDDELAIEEARQYNLANPKTADKNSSDKAGDKENSVAMEPDSCTITIRCDTILKNMENLTKGKNAYVPSNGCILTTSSVEFDEGETVFDVLKRTCSRAKIQLEYEWTPLYGSYYIEGINNLYEFDCGNESGWMYKVNGWFPNYGCSSYELKDGDSIVWCYTCNGLGADVGCTFMER